MQKLSRCTRVDASARGQSRKKPPPSEGGASARMKSTMILPCGVSRALKPAAAGVTLAMSLVTSPLRNLRASSPATLTTPRSGSSAAFMVRDRTDVAAKRKALVAGSQVRVGMFAQAAERASIAGNEELPGAVGRDPQAVEGIDPQFHHVLVVGARDNPKKLQLL